MAERAAYASFPDRSRGRLYDTGSSPTRSEFQRDRDRILHSTAFRRLQYKTQVFLHHEGQHYRTRLTHTLEVSQMARSIARALGLDEDLTEAVALAHDLGHTPFGHAGERVLNDKLAQWGGFDHNMQAVRVVTRLESRYAEHDGLNLSWEALEGILKHNGPLVHRDGSPYRADKPAPAGLGEIPASEDLMAWSHASLEAQAAAIADDIAYNSHDIDDALRAGLVKLPDLVGVPLVGPLAAEVLARWPSLERSRQAHELQRRLITAQIEDVIAESERMIAEAAPQSADDVRFVGRTLIRYSPRMAEAEKGLKRFLYERVYRSDAVMAPVRRSQTMVSMLFDHYLVTLDMPGRWGEAARAAGDRGARAGIVADFVAGMTDPYAEEQHARLFDGAGGLG
ncbi:MAG: deoxyguanosinetriphosphate triphosphohydrolase [Devosia sp.]